ncbi:MAG: hypothetical protein M3M85_04395 [bacterium]|nr:hypothetical protein [bacterium]
MQKAKRDSVSNSELLEMCRKCYAFKYDNSWHFERPEYLLEKDADEKISVRFGICAACVEEALALYDMGYA